MIRKILVPTDFSECAAEGLARAKELARAADAELFLVHAIELPLVPANERAFIPSYVYDEQTARAKERFNALLADVQQTTRARGSIDMGPAFMVIDDAIRREKPDLIVIGMNGRRGIGRVFMGSVAERVARTSNVPMLAVRKSAERKLRHEGSDGERP